MKSKYRFRRILSGVMAAVTILSTVISPLTVYASEEPKAAEPPAYESVKDQLDENEVVKATDLELEVGQDFDVSTDFTNLEIKDESKVKVTFQKAENDAGENFSTSHADTYHAVYYVEPVNQNHPVYQIGRNLIVKEPVTAAQSEPQTEQAVTEEDTGSDDEEAASQEETETVPVETEIVEPETAESETEEPEETEEEVIDLEAKPEITFDDFEKLQFQVGEIIACEEVKKSKKLLCSQVKIGSEVKQIVSGIKKHYSAEEMVGKKVMVLVNLKPAKLAGVLSEGMLLCAEDAEGNLALMTPEKNMPAGAEIC